MRRRLLIGGCILAAAAFGGGAYAASNTHTNPKQAFLNDVAKRLHVSPQQLKSAFEGATEDQLKAAVKAGKLTQAQANAIEQRLREGAPPALPFFHRGLRRAPFLGGGPLIALGPLGAASQYLGAGIRQLFDQLSKGQSLAQIATAHGKSVSGLERAMVAAERSRLDRARKDGLLTSAQEQRLLSRLQAKISALVNQRGFVPPHQLRYGPPHPPRFLPPGGPRFGPRLVPPLGVAPAGPPPLS